MAHITHPLVGIRFTVVVRVRQRSIGRVHCVLRKFDRQALHATMLRLYHPISRDSNGMACADPQDMVELIDAMRAILKNTKIKWTG